MEYIPGRKQFYINSYEQRIGVWFLYGSYKDGTLHENGTFIYHCQILFDEIYKNRQYNNNDIEVFEAFYYVIDKYDLVMDGYNVVCKLGG